MTQRFTIALVAVILFVLMAVMPVSAAALWANGTVINQGALITDSEDGLNVTHAGTVPASTTPARSPGFGALIAISGVGAAAFIVVRRH